MLWVWRFWPTTKDSLGRGRFLMQKATPAIKPGLPKEAKEGRYQGRRCKMPFHQERFRKSREIWKRVKLMLHGLFYCLSKLHIYNQSSEYGDNFSSTFKVVVDDGVKAMSNLDLHRLSKSSQARQ
jgi:hypothetical protein